MRSVLTHWRFWLLVVGTFAVVEVGLGLSLTHSAQAGGERLNTATIIADQPGLSIGRYPNCYEYLTLQPTGSTTVTYLNIDNSRGSEPCPTSPQYAPGQILTLYQVGGVNGPMSTDSVHSAKRVAHRWLGSTAYAGLVAAIVALIYGIAALFKITAAQAKEPTIAAPVHPSETE